MSWAGIGNDNEFYSEHYLAEVFAKDAKQLLDRWKQASAVQLEASGGAVVDVQVSPDAALRALARELSTVMDALERARSPSDALAVQRPWLQSIAQALSLPWAPESRPLDDELSLIHISEPTRPY